MQTSFLDTLFADLPVLADLLIVFNPFLAAIESFFNLILFLFGGDG